MAPGTRLAGSRRFRLGHRELGGRGRRSCRMSWRDRLRDVDTLRALGGPRRVVTRAQVVRCRGCSGLSGRAQRHPALQHLHPRGEDSPEAVVASLRHRDCCRGRLACRECLQPGVRARRGGRYRTGDRLCGCEAGPELDCPLGGRSGLRVDLHCHRVCTLADEAEWSSASRPPPWSCSARALPWPTRSG